MNIGVDFGAMRKEMIRAAVGKPAAHLPSAFSILETVWAIYEVMEKEDRFILSKGHGAMALYEVLKKRGILEGDIGFMPGHPDARIMPEVQFSTGSLGHGLAAAAGMALGKSILRYAQNDKGEGGKIFCLMGDGECQEGSVWEAMRIVYDLDLKVKMIIDWNKTHPIHLTREIIYFICDGYRLEDLKATLRAESKLIIVHTQKGHGCKIFEEEPEAWHHRSPREEELEKLLEATR